MTNENPWTPAALATLRRLWRAGVPTTEIGTRMGRSKNSVIGKANRLPDISPRASPIKRADGHPPRPHAKRPPVPKLAALAPLVASDPAPSHETGERLGNFCPLAASSAPAAMVHAAAPLKTAPAPSAPVEPKTVFRPRKAGECCWPLWSHNERPTQEFCCAPAVSGRPYCPTHHAAAFTKVTNVVYSPCIKAA